MNIVLNEEEWVKEMIRTRSLGKKPFDTLRRVARYYLDNNYPRQSVRKMLDSFIMQCDPAASLPKWSNIADGALDKAIKTPALRIEYIPITGPELNRINSLNGKQVKRLAFTLLCLSKYWDVVNNTSGHWVNNKDSEIMHMANINTSIKRQSIMYRILNENGLVQFSKKVNNTNVRVCFVEDGDEVLQIRDYRNLGYQYMRSCGEPFFECQNCGITTKYNHPTHGHKQIYCKDCAVEVAIRQRVNSVMKIRNKNKERRGIDPECAESNAS